ncbi:hypothetical protein [Pseudodesulfovibrio pelocollis]|uniref:hypothetical protein n=1 Tax=Pseudodesulfovibrio pelocollis TaxID=3051432 RepID=UPI00255AC3CA|nr:hypothetical protein [Pseudodesulfovibrio sp. SB368]
MTNQKIVWSEPKDGLSAILKRLFLEFLEEHWKYRQWIARGSTPQAVEVSFEQRKRYVSHGGLSAGGYDCDFIVWRVKMTRAQFQDGFIRGLLVYGCPVTQFAPEFLEHEYRELDEEDPW